MQSKKPLGLIACTSLVVGNMIGSGIFLLPSILASIGSISIFGWIITATGAILLAYIFGKFSETLNIKGGPYAYCKQYLGNFIGYQVNLCYLIANLIGNVAIIIAIISYTSNFIPELKTNHELSFIFGLIVIWAVTLINILGLKTFKIIQITTTILKLIPIIAVISLGFYHIEFDNLLQFNISNESNISAIASSTMMTMFAFAGLESSTIPIDNVKNPKTTIKKATLIGTAFTAMIYILSTIILMGMFSPKNLATSSAPFADAGTIIFGNIANNLFTISAIITCFCTAVGFLFVSGHAAEAAAQDGLLPKTMIAKANSTPKNAFFIAAIFMSIIYYINYNQNISSQFTIMMAMSNLFLLIPYLYTSISALVAWKPILKQQKKLIFIGVLSCMYMLFSIFGLGKNVIFYGIIALFAISPFYALTKPFKDKFNKNSRPHQA